MNKNAPSVFNQNQDFAGVKRSGNDGESPALSNGSERTNTSKPTSSPPASPFVGRAPLPNSRFSGVVCQAREEHAKVSHSYTLLTDKFDFLEDKIIYDRMVLTNIVSSLEFEKSQREQELERKQENLQALKETGLQAYGTEKSEGMFDTQESRDKMRDHLNASLLALEKVNDLAIEIENDKKNIDGIFKKLLESKKQLVSITDSLKTCSETIESCRYIKKMLAEKRDEMYSLEFTQKEQVARELIALCEKVMNVRNNSDEFIAFVKEQKNMAAPLKKRGRPPLSEGGAAKRVKAAK